MKLRDCGMEIDKSEISARSIDKRNIALPYGGALPAQFDGCTQPRVCVSVSASRGAALTLVADRQNEKHKAWATIEATDDEIEELLFSFFYGLYKAPGAHRTRFDCGLTPYWLGFCQARFHEWNDLRKHYQIGQLLDRLEPSEREKLLARMERVAAEAAE